MDTLIWIWVALITLGMVLDHLNRVLDNRLRKLRAEKEVTVETPIPRGDFDRILQDLVVDDAHLLLSIPGAYELLSDHYTNDILKRWQEEQEEPGADKGLLVWYHHQALVPAAKLRHHQGALSLKACPECGAPLRPGTGTMGTVIAAVCVAPECGVAYYVEADHE